MHLNPETPSLSSECLLSYIQSYALLSDWLRNDIEVDISRVASTFINEYPSKYSQLILNEDYHPEMKTLMRDYLIYNATRNRALDMLPLFARIDEKMVNNHVNSSLVKARPTFHYRLANSSLSKPDWDFTTEWKRWLHVEKLASNDALRLKMIKDFNHLNSTQWLFTTSTWVKQTEKYLKQL
ncbi:amidoligase family protein [Legionella yabuuchiae]|uniref:amidoligase family protein n=1 Tax=Legionella yabuuchiae TaxID=376727 RepID=UPI0010566C5F|nr:amidoligase family protein [Legionella yabuuchiae]